MTSVHPHWHSTDADAQPVRVRVAQPERMPARTPMIISRHPAAIVGIVLAIGLGFAVTRGLSSLGQVVNETAIRLTAAGADPAVITVNAGQRVTWVNDDEIPHLLSSDTLRVDGGTLLDTPAIFPGATFSVTVATDAAIQPHAYISKTSALVSGQIIVQSPGGAPAAGSATSVVPTPAATATTPPPTSTTPATTTPAPVPAAMPDPVSGANASVDSFAYTMAPSSASPLAAVATPDPQPTAAAAVLPQNPYTVGSGNQPGGNGGHAPATPRPTANAETGPSLSIVSFMSVAVLYGATRRAFRRI